MKTDTSLIPDPRSLPANANLPAVNQPATLVGVTIAFLSLAVIAVSLRLWVRVRDRLWGWDDAFVVLASIASIVGDSIVCLMPQDGLGLHLWTLDNEHLMSYFRHIYSTNVAYCTSATFIKLSILYQYLRLFSETAPSTTCARYRLARRLTWVLVVLSSVWGVAFVLLAAFSCSPIAKNWNATLPGRCVGWGTKDPDEFFAMFLGHSISNLVLDIVVLLLPVPFLSMLRIGGKSKAGLITLFSLGCIVGIVAVGRMIALSVNRAGTIPIIDMSYYTPVVYILGVLEVNIAILAASIPTFWPVIATFATNKIFVVNEIEVHVESAPRSSFGSGSAIVTDNKDGFGGQHSHGPNVITRTISASNAHSKHRPKPSHSSSIGRTIALDFGGRASQDSHRNLYRTISGRNASLGSLSRSEGEDWFMELDKVKSRGKTTTTVERTDIPLEQMKAFDRR